MPDQRIQDEEGEQRLSEEHIDNVVLDFMLGDDSWPWSVDEIVREFGDRIDALDAVGRLQRTGLLHRSGEFVFPTRSARRAAELQIGTV
jgi:hypothetical protein